MVREQVGDEVGDEFSRKFPVQVGDGGDEKLFLYGLYGEKVGFEGRIQKSSNLLILSIVVREKIVKVLETMFHHIVGQPFVFATGLAALVHSTWALGTLFSGQQPEGWHLVGWLIPALLIAFALDIGQIVTSWEIREHGLTLGRGVTFFVFAAATYYLQWLYIAHHMPALDIAAGVSATARGTAVYMRDAALWIIPSFLPLSTVLYTFSGKTHPVAQKVGERPQIEIRPAEAPPPEMLPQPEESEETPFGGNLPTADESPLIENQGENASTRMIESVGAPTITENGHGKPKTPRKAVKK